jgi:hypothetical protein
MSSAERFNPSQPKAVPDIETVYTTVESEADRTDWLTVVSNLRQINRQLVEKIARLEQALASSTQKLHNHKEENQTHEITILQQQDELKITHDRVEVLFQQLENSHQIAQRQQTLIETLSQQLEISQAVIPQLEAEHEELSHQFQQQSQKLIKTERVAIELHRRLKLQITAASQASLPAAPTNPEPVPTIMAPALANVETTTAIVEDLPIDNIDDSSALSLEPNPYSVPNPYNPHYVVEKIATTPNLSTPEVAIPNPAGERLYQENILAVEGDPATLSQLTDFAHDEIPSWTPSANSFTQKAILSQSESFPQPNWPEPTANNNDTTTTTPSANWPAPTIEIDRPIAKKDNIDLPKFPKKSED